EPKVREFVVLLRRAGIGLGAGRAQQIVAIATSGRNILRRDGGRSAARPADPGRLVGRRGVLRLRRVQIGQRVALGGEFGVFVGPRLGGSVVAGVLRMVRLVGRGFVGVIQGVPANLAAP